MSEHTARLRERGHWTVVVRPCAFRPKRAAYTDLFKIAERCAVQLRGWDLPHIDRNKEPERREDFVAQSSTWEHHGERWAFYESGQFVLLRRLSSDWRDESTWWPAEKTWQAGAELPLLDTLWTYIEVYEFAARLAQAIDGDDDFRIEIALERVAGRMLTADSSGLMFFRSRGPASIERFARSRVVSREKLISSVDQMASEDAVELYQRFGYDVAQTAVEGWSQKLRARKL